MTKGSHFPGIKLYTGHKSCNNLHVKQLLIYNELNYSKQWKTTVNMYVRHHCHILHSAMHSAAYLIIVELEMQI